MSERLRVPSQSCQIAAPDKDLLPTRRQQYQLIRDGEGLEVSAPDGALTPGS